MSAILNPPVPAAPERPTEKLQRLLAEKWLREPSTAEHLAKAGANLWKSDDEFEEFLKVLRNLRQV